MKKLIAIAVAVALMIALFAVVGPVSAEQPDGGRAVFEADILPLAGASLDKGEVYVRANGDVRVEIEGAVPFTTYTVYFGDALTDTWQLKQTVSGGIGTIVTNEDGDGVLNTSLSVDWSITGTVFYPGVTINIGTTNKFASGFDLP